MRSDEAADLRQQLAALQEANLALEARATAADAAIANLEQDVATARAAAAEPTLLFDAEEFAEMWGQPEGQDAGVQPCEAGEQLAAGWPSEGQEEPLAGQQGQQEHPEAEFWEERAVHLEERLSMLEADNARLQAQVDTYTVLGLLRLALMCSILIHLVGLIIVVSVGALVLAHKWNLVCLFR